VTTQVKAEKTKEDSESSEDSSDSEEEAPAAMTPAQVRTQLQSLTWATLMPAQQEADCFLVRIWVVVVGKDSRAAPQNRLGSEFRHLLQHLSALSPQAKPDLGPQTKVSTRKKTSITPVSARITPVQIGTPAPWKAETVTSPVYPSSSTVAWGSQRPESEAIPAASVTQVRSPFVWLPWLWPSQFPGSL
jgi:hypothetical protein